MFGISKVLFLHKALNQYLQWVIWGKPLPLVARRSEDGMPATEKCQIVLRKRLIGIGKNWPLLIHSLNNNIFADFFRSHRFFFAAKWSLAHC